MTPADRPAPRYATDLAGHADSEKTLLSAWNSGRMHHAWLIAGPRGIGKATLAYRMARFVLSQSVDSASGLFSAEAAGAETLAVPADHPVARRVASGGHADLMTVERSVNAKTGKLRAEIVVEDVRRLSSFLSLTTGEGAWRVIIVDVVDEMNRSAANALLKGLEEPPARTLFLLTSHMPGRLLPTIRSRCRTLTLSPLDDDTLIGLLRQFEPQMDDADAALLARLAEGSIGQALALADAGGIELYQELERLLSGLDRLDIRAVHALGDKLGRPGAEDSFQMLGTLLDSWLNRLILARSRQAEAGSGVGGENSAVLGLWSRASLAKSIEVWENVTGLFRQAGSANLDRKQIVISAFLALEEAVRG